MLRTLVMMAAAGLVSGAACADQVVCSSNGAGVDTCDVHVPNVLDAETEYPGVQFMPGDIVTVTGAGCVQTGGAGNTWKAYVNPSGDKSEDLYHGLIAIPAASAGLTRLQDVVTPVVATSSGVLRLGYEDDAFGDNG